ncbi:MAG TPA: cell division protein FtsA [Verrucomicrobiae bacterium]|jgi:cell division protein FtsA|nr:cell division protein FtsA [Verrucomicrobiae bacterium]
MGSQTENLLTVVDVGSAKTCVIVAEVNDYALRYRGHSISDSRGMRKGVIADLDKAVDSIKKAVEEAENMAQAPVEHAIVGVAGSHIRGVNSHGGITLGSRSREISREDVRQAVDKARSINMPEDREALHLLPQEFILDGQGGVRDPAGLMGRKLEVRVHIVTASATATQNVVTAVNRAGIHVDDTVFEALACADSVLQTDERELGVCLVDIGAGSTDLIVYYEGVVIHTGAIPIGGDHFTNDIGVGFRTPLPDAESIKKMFGCAIVTRIPEGNEIEVPSVGDRPARMMQQRMLGEILEPRGRELMEMLRDHLRHSGMDELLGAGLVFTGGGSRLNGLLEVAEDILRRPVRQGYPVPIAKLPSELLEPEFGTAIGMVLYGHRSRQARMNLDRSLGARIRALFAKQGV